MKNKIAILITVLLFSGCAAISKSFKSNEVSTIVESKTLATDVKISEKVNQAIKDNANLKVTKIETDDKDFDRRVNEAVDRVLSSIDISKESGSHSYRVWYDLLSRKMKVNVTIGETKDVEKDRSTELFEDKTVVDLIEKEWKKAVLPWWIYALVAMFFRKSIFSILSFLIPGLGKVKTVKDLISRNPKE